MFAGLPLGSPEKYGWVQVIFYQELRIADNGTGRKTIENLFSR